MQACLPHAFALVSFSAYSKSLTMEAICFSLNRPLTFNGLHGIVSQNTVLFMKFHCFQLAACMIC
jgi:hypothetical protein